MKQKDIGIIVAVIILASVLSLVVTQAIFVPKKSKELTAEKVAPISSAFNEPDKTVFNENAINPTQLIQIGDGTNNNPF